MDSVIEVVEIDIDYHTALLIQLNFLKDEF